MNQYNNVFLVVYSCLHGRWYSKNDRQISAIIELLLANASGLKELRNIIKKNVTLALDLRKSFWKPCVD
jgi:hypothetical protein